jgi:2,3-bisphosphoglycerate-independent phosphoglycerate mutase
VPPRILRPDTVVVGARGAAIGAARLMGAATVVPAGATGQPDSDLAAKAAAAICAIAGGAARVVVHVGGPDEAAHLRDRAAKVAAIGRADRDLLVPLADAVCRAGATLQVCPDHGCDPRTGEHDGAPVPCVTWSPRGVALARELERILAPRTAAATAPQRCRLTERDVAHLPVVELATASALGAAA